MSNDINTLRDALFETLAGLRNKEAPMDIERAKAINDTAQTIINSAKVEVDFCKATGQVSASGFLLAAPVKPTAPALPPGAEKTAHGIKTTVAVPGAGTVTTHRMA